NGCSNELEHVSSIVPLQSQIWHGNNFRGNRIVEHHNCFAIFFARKQKPDESDKQYKYCISHFIKILKINNLGFVLCSSLQQPHRPELGKCLNDCWFSNLYK